MADERIFSQWLQMLLVCLRYHPMIVLPRLGTRRDRMRASGLGHSVADDSRSLLIRLQVDPSPDPRSVEQLQPRRTVSRTGRLVISSRARVRACRRKELTLTLS